MNVVKILMLNETSLQLCNELLWPF